MRVLICGSRRWGVIAANEDASVGRVTEIAAEKELLQARVSQLPAGTIVIHGAARGADRLAGEAATARGLEVEAYPADWRRYGRFAAGPIRNRQMLDSGIDQLIAFTRDLQSSKGTLNCVEQARKRGVPVEVLGEDL
jgi:hypothetical protein